ncbi:MAG TPA: sigma-70 family RNA polymerase sigma factor [Candidatus Limnocylindrales bacterium]|nr:sigma-70 family RNA polymerase sigma factor [Candidatus Limnocylindrales bacterium]
MDQRELVRRAAGGDHEAFDALVRLASNRLYGIAYRVLRDQHLAEDALQQALIAIWNELPRLRDADRFDAWTYRLIVRAALTEARRAGRGRGDAALLAGDSEPSQGPDEIGAVADRELLERGFRRITPEQRAVLVLQHYAGLSLAEIADAIGIPIGTAGSRLHYAARALRAAIDADSRIGSGRESIA